MENRSISIGIIFSIVVFIALLIFSNVITRINNNNTKKLELQKYNEYILEETPEISAQEFLSLLYRVDEQNIKNKKELEYEINKENLENSRNILKNTEKSIDDIKDEDIFKITVKLKVLNPEYIDANVEKRQKLEKYIITTGDKIIEKGQHNFSDNLGKERFKEVEKEYYSNGKIKTIVYQLLEEQ